ncbi:MAG: hypothetical protein WBG70_23900 [Spirulinaceae cyanobacterium]
MNALWPRFLKSAYRKDPVSSFIFTIGAVDAVIGGVGERWTLLGFGIMTIFLAIAIRWWQIQQSQESLTEEVPRRFLPPSPSNAPLPMLKTKERDW